MIVTIINDCQDENAKGRQIARTAALFDAPVNFIGVKNDLEAAGNLIDTIDALADQEATILVNVAPRNGAAKRWPNGTPFGYFRYQNILIVSSIDGYALSLIKKFKLIDTVTVLDIRTSLIAAGYDDETAARAGTSQFRSFDFLPRIGAYLAEGRDVSGTQLTLSDVPDAPDAIWWIDNFGNAKTTLTDTPASEIIETSLRQFKYYPQLRVVPDGELAVIAGSSGLGKTRFLEIVGQGISAQNKLGLVSGQTFLILNKLSDFVGATSRV